MATVFFCAALRPYTGGVEEATIAATNVRELYAALESRFPGIGQRVESGMAVAIDGEIIQEPLLEEIAPESEVHFLPSISGG